jgi:hypothetical protein
MRASRSGYVQAPLRPASPSDTFARPMKTEAATPDPMSVIRSRRFVLLQLVTAIGGLVVSFAAWGFLELVHQIQVGVFTDLPKDVGYDNGAPPWA